ncbi:MAG: argininosuccinate lyase [Sutterella sp.]|nr:argininosuccinate lyase [Sutterella sp.]
MIRDDFFWLNKINRATVVVGLKNAQFDEALARRAARGIAAVEAEGEADPAKRVKKYIAWEPMFIAAAGPEVTVIHAGRSSQDILSTVRTAMLRDRMLTFAAGLDDVIGDLLKLAERHRDTVVPSYTNGVAAQPTSYAHYLLGITASLLRVRERTGAAIARYNESSMGATVLNGTCWPLDRAGMAESLGFPRPVENALDATSLFPVDAPLEAASCAAQAAVRIGSMINDIMVQYAQPRPWILLKEGGENTYVSSAMPQKRNPGLMNNCREDCSDVIGEMMTSFTRVHNVVPGMVDGKSTAKNARMMTTAAGMLARFRKVLAGLVINPERALEELNSDWTASQEIADRLMRDHGLPFRIGHHMASRMVGFARANGILPLDFPYAEMQRIYREEITEEFPEGDPVLPMTEAEFRDALDPRRIVAGRRTAGSCAPSEIDAMLGTAVSRLAELRAEREACARRIDESLERLDLAFETLI